MEQEPTPAAGGSSDAGQEQQSAPLLPSLAPPLEQESSAPGEGTPLRGVVRTCRLALNDALRLGQGRWEENKGRVDELLLTSQVHTQMALDKMGVEYSDMSTFKRRHPTTFIVGVTAAVAIPSLIGGKRLFLRNATLAAALAASSTYGVDWWERRRGAPKDDES